MQIGVVSACTIIPTAAARHTITSAIRHGQPSSYLPPVSPRDVIYVAGGPSLVKTVARIAHTHGVECYSDPFLPAADSSDAKTILSRATRLLTSFASNPPSPVFVERH